MVSAKTIAERLKSADWLRQTETRRLLTLLDGEGGRTRAVGGIVRDTLLAVPRPRTDIDFATELLPHEVTIRAERAGIAVHPTGIEHGTVTLRLGTLIAEVTTLREDVETDGRRAVVRFGTDWTHDAGRRDFTLNALYAGLDGALFDPLGGLADCMAGRVRFIGDPDRRIAEDRLRVIRFFRFSASHGGERFDADGLAACRRAAGDLGALSAERVGSEIKRMLALPRVAATLKMMAEAGIVALSDEAVERLLAYERHAHRPEAAARLALIVASGDAAEIKLRWRLSNDDISSAEAILSVARLLVEYSLSEAAYRHPAAVAEGVEVAAVLAGWTEAGKSAILDQLQSLDVPRFPVSGSDLVKAGLLPGRALGVELDRLEQLWIESKFALDREKLLAAIRR